MAMANMKKIVPPPVAIVDNIVFSKTEAWAFWNLPLTAYDFLSMQGKAAILAQDSNALISLMKGRDDPVDCKLILTNSPLDVNHWEENYIALSSTWNHRSGFDEFIRNQIDLMKHEYSFVDKRVFFGVKLNNRLALDFDAINPFQKGFKDAMEYAKRFLNSMLAVPNNVIPDGEIAREHALEESYNTIISNSALDGVRSTTEELALLIKQTLYPAMPVPNIQLETDSRWGAGDAYEDLISDIRPRENPKYIRINQTIGGRPYTGYRATLTFKSFPPKMQPPISEPWIYYSINSGVSNPFDVFSTFTIVPNAVIRKEIEKNKKVRQDGFDNATKAGVDPSSELISDLDEATELDAFAAQNHQPWVKSTTRMVLTASSVEQLEKDAETMIQKYGDRGVGIKLIWTTHDQVDLLLESMPGANLMEKSFVQMSTMSLISASGFNVYNEIGD